MTSAAGSHTEGCCTAELCCELIYTQPFLQLVVKRYYELYVFLHFVLLNCVLFVLVIYRCWTCVYTVCHVKIV